MEKPTFEHGVFYAAATIADLHDQPGMAADIIKEAGLENYDCALLDEFDRERLKKVQGERGIQLRNL